MQDAPYRLLPLYKADGSIRAYATIDADVDLGEWRWHMDDEGYAARRANQRLIRLHRVILGLVPGDGFYGDHISRDKLDNRRANLRVLTPAQNSQNQSPHCDGVSVYRGVTWNKQCGKWQARAAISGKRHHVGLFVCEEEAAAAASAFRLKHMPFATD